MRGPVLWNFVSWLFYSRSPTVFIPVYFNINNLGASLGVLHLGRGFATPFVEREFGGSADVRRPIDPSSELLVAGLDDGRLVVGRVPEFDPMAGVASVGLAPSNRGVLREPFGLLRAVPARRAPRPHVVGEVTRVALVVERELFDGVVPDAELVELPSEVPLAVTPPAGYRRRVLEVVASRVDSVAWV